MPGLSVQKTGALTGSGDSKQARLVRMCRKGAFFVLRWSGLPFLFTEFFQRNKVTILAYHKPTYEMFEKHLRALARRYRFCALRDVVRAKASGNWGVLPRKGLVLTLDDGHRSNFALRGLFAKHGVCPSIFVCAGIAGTNRRFWFLTTEDQSRLEELKRLPQEMRLRRLRGNGFEETREYGARQALSGEEIHSLKSVAEVQSHTMFHPILPNCTRDRALAEISESKRFLEERYGLNVYALAYPNGDYSLRDQGLARAAGYSCALTVDGWSASRRSDLYRFSRIAVPDEASVDELIVKASGAWTLIQKLMKKVKLLVKVTAKDARRQRSLDSLVRADQTS